MKKIICFIVIFVMIFSMSTSFADSKVTIDGKKKEISDVMTWVPVFEVLEQVGAKIEYEDEGCIKRATLGDDYLEFDKCDNRIRVNDQTLYHFEHYWLYEGKVYMPIQSLAYAMNIEISADNNIAIKSQEAIKKELAAKKNLVKRKYPKLFKAFENLEKKSFENKTNMNMELVDYKFSDEDEVIDEEEHFSISIKAESVIDNDDFKVNILLDTIQGNYRDCEEMGMIALDNNYYLKEYGIWKKTDLVDDELFSSSTNSDATIGFIIEYSKYMRKTYLKDGTQYTIKLDELEFDDFIKSIGKQFAMMGELDEAGNSADIKIKDFKWVFKVDKKSNLKSSNLSASMEFFDKYSDDSIEFDLKLDSTYMKHGEKMNIQNPLEDISDISLIDIDKLNFEVDGKSVENIDCIEFGNKIMVSLDSLEKLLGVKYTIQEDIGQINIEGNNENIVVFPDYRYCIVNNYITFTYINIEEIENKYYLPLSYFVYQLGGIAYKDFEKSSINIISKEEREGLVQSEIKKLKSKHYKLYKALDQLSKKPYKCVTDNVYKSDNLLNLLSEDDVKYQEVQYKINGSYYYDTKHMIDQIDMENKIKKSYDAVTLYYDSMARVKKIIAFDNKLYSTPYIFEEDLDKNYWGEFDFPNTIDNFNKIPYDVYLYSDDLTMEETQEGTLFTLTISDDNKEELAMQRLIYDLGDRESHFDLFRENIHIKEVYISYLIDKSGMLKTREYKYILEDKSKYMKADLTIEGTAEYSEIGEAIEVVAPEIQEY